NLEIFGRMLGMTRAAAQAGATALLEDLGLADAAEQDVAAYSTGMKARLALARARLGSPALLVLDEPSRGLDTAGEEAFVRWLKGRPAGGVVWATHNLEEAAAVAHRCFVLDQGEVVREIPTGRSPDELEAMLRSLES